MEVGMNIDQDLSHGRSPEKMARDQKMVGILCWIVAVVLAVTLVAWVVGCIHANCPSM